uniref:WW domain-containing protein n=1 Tax=Ditylum brightwellii TaxID=49249 RepID=A0A7S4RGY3_9STRA
MTRISQVEDRGAVVAWSPIYSHADVIALGTKDSGGVGFDDYGGELELCDMKITCPEGSQPTPQVIGSIKTTTRFSSLGWTPGNASVADNFKMGLIAGGMTDGKINIWDAESIVSSPSSAAVASIDNHTGGAVSALQFNPHPTSANLLASGGSDGGVLITSLEKPDQPNVFVPAPDQPSQGAEITQIGWNTQVAHIVASAAKNGTAFVWDLRAKKPWCELRCESNYSAVSDLAWNPNQGLHLLTASDDDRNPVIKLWDLRSSTTIPLATLEGHTQGVLSMAWCPHDDTLLMSCGKDNRTLLWDLTTLKPIVEIPSSDHDDTSSANASSSAVYGNLGSSQQKRFDVQWSPHRRGVVSTCSFDRKVQAHSVIGVATKCGRPPKWMKTPGGVSCGFGGTVTSFGATHRFITINSHIEQPELKQASMQFEYQISGGDYAGFCGTMVENATKASDHKEAQVWGFMKIIFDTNARELLLKYLGFDSDKISQIASEFVDNGAAADGTANPSSPSMSEKAEDIVKEALLVGNFEAAVDCCFRNGNLADALVLASCGGAELWAKTQAEYFAREAQKRPFLSIVSAVIHNQLEDLVAASDPSKWQETLAILSTYGKSEEFPLLCLALGNRLEGAGDGASASLCFMCALNLDRAVKHWKTQLEKADQVAGKRDLLALHSFVQKVTVMLEAIGPNTQLDSEIAELFSDYAKALSEQGLLVYASKYCKSDSQQCNELKDRIYRSKDGRNCSNLMASPPAFPYTLDKVEIIPVASVQAQVQHEETQQQATTTQQQHDVSQQQQQQQQQTNGVAQLPPGWVALQDPSTGNTYYANQTTGESSWEMPRAVESVAAPAPSQQFSQHTSTEAYQQQQSTAQHATEQQTTQQQSTLNGATPSKLVSKYGDGFVTSSSHPELGEQYGNVGTR